MTWCLYRQEAEIGRKRTQGQTEGLEPEGHQVASASHGLSSAENGGKQPGSESRTLCADEVCAPAEHFSMDVFFFPTL